MAANEWKRYFWSARTLRCAVFSAVGDDHYHGLERYEDCLAVDEHGAIMVVDPAFGDVLVDALNTSARTPEVATLRASARAMMLKASARAGVVTVPESSAIDLLHALSDVAQVPCRNEATGELTWTTEPA